MHDGETAARLPTPRASQRHQALFLDLNGILVQIAACSVELPQPLRALSDR